MMDSQREIDLWFQHNGLPWFIAHERQRARQALRPRTAVPVLLVVILAAVGAAVGLTWLTGQGTYAPASLTLVAVIASLLYFITALRARPLVAWSLRRTALSTRQLLPMVTRALPHWYAEPPRAPRSSGTLGPCWTGGRSPRRSSDTTRYAAGSG